MSKYYHYHLTPMVLTPMVLSANDSKLQTCLEDANLAMTFGVISGFSDHTLGAKVIEKHFILDKFIGGADADFSLDKKEFAEMIQTVRVAKKLLEKVDYSMTDKKKKSRQFSRSLYVDEDIKAGNIITEQDVRSVRPGYGLHPKYLKDLLGKKAVIELSKGTALKMEMFH